ncbi:hypothetical protein PABG_05307 [Paracoccidioides brasiliensis Pb03]|nr:hypothetical protein PABG_05307 [Paracoccidioides brasiliensis Pb03]
MPLPNVDTLEVPYKTTIKSFTREFMIPQAPSFTQQHVSALKTLDTWNTVRTLTYADIMIQEPVFDRVTVYFNFRRFLTGNPIYPTSTSPLLQTHSPSSGFPLAPRESHYRLFSILKKRAKTHSPSTTTSSLANLRGSRFQSNGEDERLDGFVSHIMFVPHIEVVLNAGRFAQQRRRGRPRNREWNGVYSLDQA